VRTVKGDGDHERLLILRTDWLSPTFRRRVDGKRDFRLR
jgi:hypothetical protein